MAQWNLSEVRCKQGGIYRREQGALLEEYLRFQMSRNEQENLFAGTIEHDGVCKCVQCSSLKVDRRILSSLSPMKSHEENKEAGSTTQEVQKNDFIVSVDPGNTNIVTIAAPKCQKDGVDGNLCQKDMRLLKFSRARKYGESGIMNARKKSETWDTGVKEHLEAIIQVTSRGADFEDLRGFIKFQNAHDEELWKEDTKPLWARQRLNLLRGRQRAFANFSSMS
jgi:hypothetical protein